MIAKVVASQPVLKDNVRAKEVIPEFAENNGKVILHAGPPVDYKEYARPDAGILRRCCNVRGVGRDRRRSKKDA